MNGKAVTKQELMQENESLRDLLLQIRDRIDKELEEFEISGRGGRRRSLIGTMARRSGGPSSDRSYDL